MLSLYTHLLLSSLLIANLLISKCMPFWFVNLSMFNLIKQVVTVVKSSAQYILESTFLLPFISFLKYISKQYCKFFCIPKKTMIL